MGDGDNAAFVERRASCLADFEIPLLASFPYLLDGAERVLRGQWFGRDARSVSDAPRVRRSVVVARRIRHDRQLRSIPGRLKRDYRRHALPPVSGGWRARVRSGFGSVVRGVRRSSPGEPDDVA